MHGANTYGFDKVCLEEREAWVLENSERIRSVAQDPFGEAQSFWTEADKPWQFLAFCFEWDAALAHGPGYFDSADVRLDGTCNGLLALLGSLT